MIKTYKEPNSLPLISTDTYETVITHGNKFAVITLNDTEKAREINANAPKFSVYVGNGKEINKNPKNPNQILKFDIQNDKQETVAAQFHVTSLTDISTFSFVLQPGQILSSRSAIKGKADVCEFNANEMIILNAGAPSRNSNDLKTFVPGGVHIYSGDREGAGSVPSQPMVLGNNLQTALMEIYNTQQSLSTSITDINTEIMTLKTQLIAHVHVGVLGTVSPSPDLAIQLPISMLIKCLKRLINAFIEMINHWFEQINRVYPISIKNILSTFNTVN